MSATVHRILSGTSGFRQGSAYIAGLAILVVLIWAAAAPAAAPVAGDGGIVFSCTAADAKALFLAGDFNGWNATSLPLTRNGDGLWTVTVPLAPGAYEYKFIQDGNWVQDPENPEQKSDPYGGFNSVVTVLDDGTVPAAAVPAVKAPAAAPAAPGAPGADPGDFTVGPPRAVKGGILFTYGDPAAKQVFLAGTFNGWNAAQTALKKNAKGSWGVVQKLDAGQHEYKFVVDGNWLADPENPQTQSDPYGGVNSLVIVDAKGNLTAAAAPAADPGLRPASNTALNPKLYVSGRYLTRFEMAKNVQDDPRYRLLRPSQSVDLNFETKVNDLVDSYMRLRMDSNENVILNNITGNLDEAHLYVHPDKFTVKAYWNQETFTSPDPLNLVGNIDHPATIGHDHLRLGKGTGGALVEADPFGLHFEGFFANVHNYDYYNDPRLYDNTGGDRIWARLSHRIGPLEIGIPLWMQRDLIWMNFETLVGQSSTGIPALDAFRVRTGDTSTWFETETHDYKVGVDASLPLRRETMKLGLQAMYVDLLGRFVTGNQAGQNNVNGSIDVPYNERQETLAALRWDYHPDVETSAWVRHTYRDMRGAAADQRTMVLGFQDQAVAENHIFFTIAESPAQTSGQLTEAEASWRRGERDLKLYLRHESLKEDYAPVARTVPGDPARTSRTIGTWYLSGLVGQGAPTSKLGHAELEFALTLQDPDVGNQDFKSYELIGRYKKGISRSVSAIADVRFIRYDLVLADPSTGLDLPLDGNFWAPFVGLQYQPLRNLDLVFGYGLDPVELSIDYSGRQFGRWWYRQNYLFAHPDAGPLDAEQNLEDARIFTLRAQMTF